MLFAKNKHLVIKDRNIELMIYSLTNIVLGFQFRIVLMPDERFSRDDIIDEITSIVSGYIYGL